MLLLIPMGASIVTGRVLRRVRVTGVGTRGDAKAGRMRRGRGEHTPLPVVRRAQSTSAGIMVDKAQDRCDNHSTRAGV